MQGVGRLLFEGTSSPARHADTTPARHTDTTSISINIAKDRYRRFEGKSSAGCRVPGRLPLGPALLRAPTLRESELAQELLITLIMNNRHTTRAWLLRLEPYITPIDASPTPTPLVQTVALKLLVAQCSG